VTKILNGCRKDERRKISRGGGGCSSDLFLQILKDVLCEQLPSKIVSSLSITPPIFKFPHINSERNHKLRGIFIQKGDQNDFSVASLSLVITDEVVLFNLTNSYSFCH
jgi:hypothetical protein